MGFAILDDRTGRMEIAIFSEVFEKYRDLFSNDNILVVEGSFSIDDYTGNPRLTAERVLTIEQARGYFARRLMIRWHRSGEEKGLSSQFVADLQQLIEPFQGGGCPVCVEYQGKSARSQILLGETWRVHPGDELLLRLRNRLGEDRVQMTY